ncbi:hypothetical protein [Gluconobacter kanchanaburiensis]|uniref:Lipoprotein n=1 Tax=Gluconobacter kanchanaburiensis NBRC 103587 TaxID=1307948 RepID=A0A511B887_9PROT|nr:hypothetical protein [Gluconobacter kanchanaburiensis]MBF0862178.1 hypothetical protein [Gluconobacter kanchanaburiensis]GEK96554.1 hypothetical protein GKA01_17510 [Gluconobacter kanchanaburiensis NBRC 103587]
MRVSLPLPTLLPAFCLLGCLAASPSLRPASHPPSGHTDDAIPVTSENAEYCDRLRKSVDVELAAPAVIIPLGVMEDARHLRAKGSVLCTQGHVRAGIERLRRALVLLKHAPEPR